MEKMALASLHVSPAKRTIIVRIHAIDMEDQSTEKKTQGYDTEELYVISCLLALLLID
jgi:hypothetical protein